MRVQTEQKLFRLQKKDMEMLQKKAAEKGISQSAYLRSLIQNRPIDNLEIKELLRNLLYEVNRIGNNVNQIAHHMNEGLYFKEDRDQLLAEQRELEWQVTRVAELLRKSR